VFFLFSVFEPLASKKSVSLCSISALTPGAMLYDKPSELPDNLSPILVPVFSYEMTSTKYTLAASFKPYCTAKSLVSTLLVLALPPAPAIVSEPKPT